MKYRFCSIQYTDLNNSQEIKSVDSPHVVRMSFELSYLDWSIFQSSKLFRDLTAYLEKYEEIRADRLLVKFASLDEGIQRFVIELIRNHDLSEIHSFIKKYQSLDECGKKVVDLTLDAVNQTENESL